MNTPQSTPPHARQHPLLIVAALAVILFCAVGTAAILGWLPSSHGTTRNPANDPAAVAGAQPIAGAAATGYAATTPAPASAPASAPAAQLPGQPAPAAPLPGQPVPDAYAPAQAGSAQQGVAAVAPAGSAAYGASGSQGATVAGDGAYTVPPASQPAPRVTEADNASHWCSTCGNVESIHEITTRARGSGVGAGAGAILGGLLGNQIGRGSGRSIATVAGAVGGAVMGNRVEGNMHASTSYEIRVRLDDGSLHTFHQHSAPQWRTGDRVRIVKGTLRSA